MFEKKKYKKILKSNLKKRLEEHNLNQCAWCPYSSKRCIWSVILKSSMISRVFLSVEMWLHHHRSRRNPNCGFFLILWYIFAILAMAVRALMFPFERLNWSRHPPFYHKTLLGQGNDSADVEFDTITTARNSEVKLIFDL